MLTPEEARHIASLARLGMTDEEIETMRIELSQVLDHIAMLDKLDTSAIQPTAQIITRLNTTRDDVAQASLSLEAVLRNAPSSEDGFFMVPPALEDVKSPSVGEASGAFNV